MQYIKIKVTLIKVGKKIKKSQLKEKKSRPGGTICYVNFQSTYCNLIIV